MKPQHAVAIRAFDYLAAISFGTAAALAASFVVPDAFPAPVAMLSGMVLGVIVGFALLGVFTFLLAGFELVMMAMQVSMIAGMAGVMVGSGAGDVALVGAGVGFLIHLFLHIADRALEGEVMHHE